MVVRGLGEAYTVVVPDVSVGIWLALERLMFARTGGLRTLSDILATWRPSANSREQANPDSSKDWRQDQETSGAGLERTASPTPGENLETPGLDQMAMRHSQEDESKGVENTVHEYTDTMHLDTMPGNHPRTSNVEPDIEQGGVSSGATGPTARGLGRFREVSKRIINTLQIARTINPTNTSPQQVTSGVQTQLDLNKPSLCRYLPNKHHLCHNLTRIQSQVKTLRNLQSGQAFNEHMALVEHLQFSPDGQFLATCSWDEAALIWKVGPGPNNHPKVLHKLVHTSPIGQVAWSPGSGDYLLTKQHRGVNVWDTKNGELKAHINRPRNVQAITWLPKGLGFMSVEWQTNTRVQEAENRAQHYVKSILGSDLVVLATDGKVQNKHHLERLQVWSLVVTPDKQRVVAVATLVRSTTGLRPVKSRSEKRISQRGEYVLVSYQNKASPQVWRIESGQVCRLDLANTYFTKHPVEFAGSSHFGGAGDALVICASKGLFPYSINHEDTFSLVAGLGGEIYIWERESGLPLHTLKAPDQELVNLAWNHHLPEDLMFASTAHDGAVRIWTTATSPLTLTPGPYIASELTQGEGSAQIGLFPEVDQ
ncbi:hypothetical protein FRC07_014243 [Ceratobasidium sp. 392]|nr:hypothetical protein FRC07_014243 [Ceratobasidium sp. 392]